MSCSTMMQSSRFIAACMMSFQFSPVIILHTHECDHLAHARV
jgi:hypothetical protein